MRSTVGEVFVPGEVWQTSHGTLWKVLRYEWGDEGKRVLMRRGEDGRGRKQYRPWDAVHGWVMQSYADGTPTGVDGKLER